MCACVIILGPIVAFGVFPMILLLAIQHFEVLKAVLALRAKHLEHLSSLSPDTIIAEENGQEESGLLDLRRLGS